MSGSSETVKRSLAKTISWRIFVLIIDFSIAYFFTRDVDLSSKLAVAKLVISSVFYFVHERFWNKVSWGRN